MVKSLYTIFATVTMAAMLFVSSAIFIGNTANAATAIPINADLCAGIGTAVGDGQGCGTAAAGNGAINDLIATVINIVSIIVGAVAVIMIIVGGLRYIVSAGDSTGVQGAKNTILYAIVGIIIVVFAQVIVRFVINRATNQQ